MRTFEEVERDFAAMRAEAAEIAAAKAAEIAGGYVLDFLSNGMEKMRAEFGRCRNRAITVERSDGVLSVDIYAGSTARFWYGLNTCLWSAGGKITESMKVLRRWEKEVAAQAAERDKDRAEAQFEIAGGAGRDDPDTPQPVYEGKGSTPDDENGPDPFADA